jgi:membrane-associated phospholipid phosphatase
MTLLKAVRENFLFFIGYFLFLLIGAYLNLHYTQKQLFFFVNRHYNVFWDYFMEYYTYAGDGVFCVIVCILLGFIRIRYAIMGLLGYAIEGIFVQILKLEFYDDRQRPWREWTNDHMHLIKNFVPYVNNSFPSGHTATAFLLATLLVLIFAKLRLGWLWFSLAITVAYARIYLAQHHFVDVYWGSIVGFVSAIIIYAYFYSPKRKFNRQQTWLDRPLLKLKG